MLSRRPRRLQPDPDGGAIELVQNQVRQQTATEIGAALEELVAAVPGPARQPMEAEIDEWNETARYERLWTTDSAEVAVAAVPWNSVTKLQAL